MPFADLEQNLCTLISSLEAEREALSRNDVDALHKTTSEKLGMLRQLEKFNSEASQEKWPEELNQLLRQAAELNVRNGALISARQRHAAWALQQIGRTDPQLGYNELGVTGSSIEHRLLGSA